MSAQKIPTSIHVTVNKVEREIFMSFAVLNRLNMIVGNIGELHNTLLQPQMSEAVLCELLTQRDAKGKVLEKIENLDGIDIDLDTAKALLDFVTDHLMDFFMEALEKAQALQQKYLDNPKMPKAV